MGDLGGRDGDGGRVSRQGGLVQIALLRITWEHFNSTHLLFAILPFFLRQIEPDREGWEGRGAEPTETPSQDDPTPTQG